MSNGIPSPEEYAKRHQKAFRAAFDFLNKHFPPGDGEEWWLGVAKDADIASIENGENKLVNGLIAGVMDYIEDEWKRRKCNGKTED